LPADAQQWLDRGRVIAQLERDYAERPAGAGVASNGGVMELFIAPGGATWTLVLTMPNGLSRLVAAGEGWASVPPRLEGAPL
jgi:hypothetical protein